MKHVLAGSLLALATLVTSGAAIAGPAWQENAVIPTPPGCSTLKWNVVTNGDKMTGVVWFTDGSGFASATGMIDRATNTFRLAMTPVSGVSPPMGEVNGSFDGPEVHAAFTKGGKCSDMKVVFKQGADTATPER